MTITEAPPRRTTHRAEPEKPARATRLLFGPPDQPRWARPGLWTLLIATAVLYLWGLSKSGWANDFYAAAVQAGTQSWKALLFGSLDAGNAITVDKPPASLWVMGLSGRLLGFSSFSMLLPQALMGVASVGLVHGAVRRWSGPAAGLLAGAVLALTPVAALMFKFNNPDALLVLLLIVAAYCTVRATEHGSGRWLALAGVAVGFGFLTKMMQAFLVLPALGLVFLVAAPIGFWRRIVKLLGAFVAMVISGGWFVALVSLWPTDSRPYIGGSTDNSLLDLALGYNGLGRVLGGEGNGGGGGGGGGGNTGFGGSTGITRMFGDSMGTEISWLLPAALIGLVAGLWFTRRTPRTGRTRAALLLWGGWLLVTGVVFSYMQGTMHPYYTVALAPAIAAVVAISVTELWRGRQFLTARIALGAISATTGVWNYILLDRTPDWYPALRWIILVGSIVIAAIMIVGAHQLRKFTAVVVIAGLLFGLAGTTAYTIETAATAHSGSIPTSGPNTGRGFGGGPGGGGNAPGGMSTEAGASARPANGATDAPTTASGTEDQAAADPSGAGGGPGNASSNNTELQEMLKKTDTRWAAATVGSQSAGSLELATATSVMAIGGFTGSDNSPTLAQFQQYVANGDITYFISGGGMGGGRGGDASSSSEITAWVQAHYTATTVGGSTVYDLTQPTS
ncbi:glycosyltransferase family 39 protein [Nocardia sp. NBC_00565]|uniref:ArnT family glycosyltransferase n=1 Tax=Nocardia sp. NBC_00565 TaxID=2975993 RepID=UPI002E805666|nr:glycosyltransferase family 39 protein [Nocardia sp. NBC_00565]WUC03586.1 glycosyltransferase family 39 protein [Nocardia sp. NBC_00565]